MKKLLERLLRKPKTHKIIDFHQASIQAVGKDQIKKLAQKGLSIPIVVL